MRPPRDGDLDNAGSVEQLTKADAMTTPYSMSPDGKLLTVSMAGGTDIGLIRMDRPNEILPLIQEPASQLNAEISPDGHWVAYQSAESGNFHIYVRPFPDVQAGKWQITTESSTSRTASTSRGAARPMWNPNGRELFYVTGTDSNGYAMMSVPIQTASAFQYGKPTRLFEGAYAMPLANRPFDISRDGQRFLMIKEPTTGDSKAPPAKAVVVTDWFEELRQRVAR